MADDELTIDELARQTGMTVRNVRAYQSRGLLPPPEVRGRTGWYGPEHIARIELVRELQADGFGLDLILRLLDRAAGASPELLRFTRAALAPFGDEEPEVISAEELAERWKVGDDGPELLERAVKLGLMRPLGDSGHFEAISPRLEQAARELADIGVPATSALDVVEFLREHADAVAERFVELFLEEVLEPLESESEGQIDEARLGEAIERLRPLASESLLAVFQIAMGDAVEQAFGRELEARADGKPRSKGKRRRR